MTAEDSRVEVIGSVSWCVVPPFTRLSKPSRNRDSSKLPMNTRGQPSGVCYSASPDANRERQRQQRCVFATGGRLREGCGVIPPGEQSEVERWRLRRKAGSAHRGKAVSPGLGRPSATALQVETRKGAALDLECGGRVRSELASVGRRHRFLRRAGLSARTRWRGRSQTSSPQADLD